MNVIMTSALVVAADKVGLTVGEVVSILWAWWLVNLPMNTWRDYMAGMTFDRLKHGGTVVLPTDPEELQNEPDAQRVVRYCLYLPAAAKNFMLAQLGALLYFRVLPKPWVDVGLTKLLNRLAVRQDNVGEKARHIQKRWLDRYDRRGKHT